MNTETILTDERIQTLMEYFDGVPINIFARAIEQAVLKSEQVQELIKDSEYLKEYIQMVRSKNPSTPTFDGQHWIVPRHGGGYRTVSGDIVSDHYVYFVDAINAAMEQQK